MLSLKFKGDRELNEEGRKTKVKVWKDVNEVIKNFYYIRRTGGILYFDVRYSKGGEV